MKVLVGALVALGLAMYVVGAVLDCLGNALEVKSYDQVVGVEVLINAWWDAARDPGRLAISMIREMHLLDVMWLNAVGIMAVFAWGRYRRRARAVLFVAIVLCSWSGVFGLLTLALMLADAQATGHLTLTYEMISEEQVKLAAYGVWFLGLVVSMALVGPRVHSPGDAARPARRAT